MIEIRLLMLRLFFSGTTRYRGPLESLNLHCELIKEYKFRAILIFICRFMSNSLNFIIFQGLILHAGLSRLDLTKHQYNEA